MKPKHHLYSILHWIAKEQQFDDYNIEITKCSTKGANYTSQGFYCKIVTPGKPHFNLFAKTSTMTKELRLLTCFEFYSTEILFHSELVPRYKQLEDKYNVLEEQKLLQPKYYGGSKEYMKEILVFQNLAEYGFRDFDRFSCFDWKYASKCVEQLAILHSLSIAYAEKNPEEFDLLTKDLKDGYAAQNMKHFLDCCSATSLEVCREENKEKLKQFISSMINKETFVKFSKLKKRAGLIHGDFRPSNIMHKIDKQGNLQITILDHQFAQRGNPLSDLMYFIASGSDATFRAKYFYKLLDHYHASLSRALRRLDVDPEKLYPKEEFDTDVKLFLPYGLMTAVVVLPIVTLDETTIPDTSDFVSGENFIKNSNLFLTQRLNDMVCDFMKMGVL